MRKSILYIIVFLALSFHLNTSAQLKVTADDAIKLDEMEWKDYVSGNIQNSEKEEYTYNNNGQVHSATLCEWDETAQEYQFTSKISYNYLNDLVSEKIYSQYNSESSVWQDTLKRCYTCDSQGNVETLIIYERSSNSEEWVPESKEEYIYDSNGNTTELYFYTWDTDRDTWDFHEKDIYEYDSSNREVNYTSWLWDFLFDEWVYYDKEEYAYVDGWTKYTYYEWNEMQEEWNYVYKDSSIYSTDGLQYAYLSCYWKESISSWINFSREVHTLNNSGKVTDYTEYEWNEKLSRWDYYDKEEYDYDSYNNVLLFIDYNKASQYNVWIESLKEEYQYNYDYTLEQLILPYSEPVINDVYFNSMMEKIDVYTWNSSSSSWNPASIGGFSYSDFEVLSVDLNIDAKDFVIYPVPFSEHVVVDGLVNMNLIIYDLTGQQCVNIKITDNHQVINTKKLIPGIYFISAGDRNNKFAVKKIIKY